MVQAIDLRLGNKVWDILDNNIHEVTGIKKQKVKDGWYHSIVLDDEEENHCLQEHLSSIPLTPEILEKCGFNVRHKGAEDEYRDIEIGNGLSIYEGDKNGCCEAVLETIETRCQYLHQLQNLYFCLTGVELEVKL